MCNFYFIVSVMSLWGHEDGPFSPHTSLSTRGLFLISETHIEKEGWMARLESSKIYNSTGCADPESASIFRSGRASIIGICPLKDHPKPLTVIPFEVHQHVDNMPVSLGAQLKCYISQSQQTLSLPWQGPEGGQLCPTAHLPIRMGGGRERVFRWQ